MAVEREVPIFPLEIKRGVDWDPELEWVEVEGEGDDQVTTPIDISALRFRMQIKTSHDSAVAVATLDTEDDTIVITDGPNGKFQLLLTRDQTRQLASNCVYDLFYITGSGTPGEKWDCLFEGTIKFNPVATQEPA